MTLRWLSELRATDAGYAGGKGANLGELIAAGLPVPAGFVLGVDSCAALRAGGAPAELAGDVIAALAELGEDVAVAVRSSGVDEDGADASYAGINETVHGVRGVAAVLEAVRKCCESARAARVGDYTSARASGGDGTEFAVVVQRQIAPAVAGVAFSVDPGSGDAGRIVIEAARGHGEAVVSGSVTPDRVLADKATLSVVSATSGGQRVALEPGEQGLAERRLDDAEIGSIALHDRQVHILAGLVRAIEAHYGCPQDVEWAFDADGAPWILQARAITTLGDRAAATEAARFYDHARPANSRWTRANVGEAIPGVPAPLTWSLWRAAIEHAQWSAQIELGVVPETERGSAPVVLLARGWPAISVDLVEGQLRRLPGFDADAFAEQFFGGAGSGGAAVPGAERVRSALRVLTHAPTTLRQLRRRLERAAAASEAAWTRDAWRTPDDPVRLLRATAARFRETLTVHTLQTYVCQGLYQAVERLADDRAAHLVSGDGDLSEARLADDLWRVAQGELEESAFLRRHGFHGPAEGELSARSWREDPEPVRRSVEQLRGDGARRPSSGTAARSERRREAEAELVVGLPVWRRPVLRRLINAARTAVVAREVGKTAILQDLDVARAAARAIGDDAVWCTLAELASETPAPAVRRARALTRARLLTTEPPLHFVGQPTEANDAVVAGDGVVSGIGASPGVVRGRARLIVDPGAEEQRIAPDEILVARATDPSWVSTFLAARGLVIDVGGALSHAAIIARELGVPCVIGTGNGTKLIPDGASIELDGDTGQVRFLETESA